MGKEGISEAEKLTLEFWQKHGGDAPLDAISVDGAFAIGSDVDGFAEKGDSIWEVRLGRDKFGLLWINSRTKKIQAIGTLYRK
jgi:hypothetical protein